MKIQILTWTIRELIENEASFILRPKYQRLPVWKIKRKQLLIDSILKGFDLPKFYITVYLGAKNRFEVTDGQQRISTIFEFVKDGFPLYTDTELGGVDYSGYKFSELPKKIRERFKEFELTFSEIRQFDQGEVNELFTRLQKGVELNPVELRHALFSNFGFYVDEFLSLPEISDTFTDFAIPKGRYKHQEYLDHVLALLNYNNTKDLKSELMYELYQRFATSPNASFIKYFNTIALVLKKMKTINNYNKGIFKNKWCFVDAFWILSQNKAKLTKIDAESFSNLFLEFNKYRVQFRNTPEKALRSRKLNYGKELYSYIQNFEKEAAKKESIKNRNIALQFILKPVL